MSQSQTPQQPGYLPVLDGWRGVAILFVLLFHGLFASSMEGHPYLQSIASVAGRLGALGVLVFFAISGYLITKRLRAEFDRTGSLSLRTFYIKRFFRIIPPLAVFLATIAALAYVHRITLVRNDWTAAVFLTNYAPGSWYTSHFWSLSVEEHFYLFWPICIVLAGWRRAIGIGIFIVMAVAIWRPWMLHHAAYPDLALQHTDMRLDYIMSGCVLAIAVELYPRASRTLERLGGSAGLMLLFLALLGSTRSTGLRSLQSILITLIVCASSLEKSRLPALLLTNRPILWIGRLSYSLYIWQQLILARASSPFWNAPQALLIKYPAAFLAAYLSYTFFEKPCIRYGRNLAASQRTQLPAPPCGEPSLST